MDAVVICTVAIVAAPRLAISPRATTHAATSAGVEITEIAITVIVVAVLSLGVVTIKASAARLFVAVARVTRILTFRVAGDTKVAAEPSVPEIILWYLRAFQAAHRVAERRTKIGGTSLISRLLDSRFRIFPGLGASFQRQALRSELNPSLPRLLPHQLALKTP